MTEDEVLASRVPKSPRTVRYLLYASGAATLVTLAYLTLWPVSIEPVEWHPKPGPGFTGAFATNTRLATVEHLPIGPHAGPEAIAFDGEGRIYAGCADGAIVRLDADGKNPEVFANTGGRPLGMDFDASGRLIVADAVRGLLSISADGRIATLVREAAGEPLGFADDLDIAKDGTIYFSDASTKFGIHDTTLGVIEHGGHGRLIAFEPKSGDVRVLVSGLQFANGVALSADDSFVLVNETFAYRITRHWLSGPNAGKTDVFYDNLPGFPDNVTRDDSGLFWVALFSPRVASVDALAPRPFFRKVLARLPTALAPKPALYGHTIAFDRDARVRHDLQDPSGGYAPITSARRVGDRLWLGSLTASAIGAIDVEVDDPVVP